MKAAIVLALIALFALFAVAPATASEVAVAEADEIADEIDIADEVDAEDEDEEAVDDEDEAEDEDEIDEEADEESEDESEADEEADESMENTPDVSCLQHYNGAEAAAAAKQVASWWAAAQVKYSKGVGTDVVTFFPQPAVGPTNHLGNGYSFVWASMAKDLKYQCFMERDQKDGFAKLLALMKTKGGFAKEPKAVGDFAVWADNVAIVEEMCANKKHVSVIGMTRNGVSSSRCLPMLEKWAPTNGKFLGFWTPHA